MSTSGYIASGIVVNVTVNGERYAVLVPPYWSLLDLLQRRLDIPGIECRCGTGDESGCTVLLDGQPVPSCSVHAADVCGHTITTIEGFAKAS